jgi:cytochrome c biogenesis protein CcmG, thiol:disulfide interchange protein DsbE
MAENAITENTTPATPAGGLRIGRILIWGVVALVLMFIALGLANTFATPPLDGQPAPEITLNLYGGGGFTLSQMHGQVVVINFWASWCAPCADEAPDLERAWQTYKDQGVQFVGVDYVDAEQNALEYIEKYGITYPNGADIGTRISDAYHIAGVPETFIVDRMGNVVFYAARPIRYDELAAEIEKALQEGG